MNRVQIQPDILNWAAFQAGLGLDDFAQKLSTRDAKKIKEGSLSEAQMRRASKIANIKLHQLFLKSPPVAAKLPLVDFRTSVTPSPLSKDFFDVYYDIEYKQLWFKDFLLREGVGPLSFVGQFKNSTNYKEIAQALRNSLSMDDKPTANNFQSYYSYLTRKAEEMGVLVFKNGIVGNNTNRPLSVKEFRGFTISDPVAPVIFINGKDSPAAWIFTLVHELAHVLRGDSALSDAASHSTNKEEIFCNKIAAEALAPEESFLSIWNDSKGSIEDKLFAAQASFTVSHLVIARRALDLNLITRPDYLKISQASQNFKPKAQSAGGNFYASLNLRNSKTLTDTVTNLAVSGSLSFKEAGKLLQVPPINVLTVHKKNNAISS